MSEEIKNTKDGIRRLVLIVDDEHVNRRLLGKIIEKEYDVIYAENGQEALEQIKKREKTLSVILIDLMMPVMDGYQFMSILNDDPDYSRIPVIVLTSERTAEVKSLQLGAADFIPKPYDMPEVILARVRRSIELAEDNSIISATENDALTGLYTKEFFFQHGIRYDQYYTDAKMDAVVLNVNSFHLVNEIHGRLFGDTVISTIASKIRLITEEKGGIACRSDSDGFYIYLPHIDDCESFLNDIVNELKSVTGNSRVSLRMGVYQNVDKSTELEMRFNRAAFACNMLRNNYNNGFVIYDDSMYHKEVYSNRLIGDMYSGVEEKQFKVYYQPKYNIRGSEPVIIGVEALIRWEHPEYGIVYPDSFVRLFEENGLVQKLDRYVWEKSAAQHQHWREKSGISLPVSVNVSRIDLYDPDIVDTLLEIVHKYGLDPSEYILEINESAFIDDAEQLTETINALRECGFRIEMDNFGAGYSSLSVLATLPIDALKLDTEFIRSVTDNEKGMRMITLMVDIARSLKIPLIAEGVETKEQYDILEKAGFGIIQGFYLSKPLPPEEFDKLIESSKR